MNTKGINKKTKIIFILPIIILLNIIIFNKCNFKGYITCSYNLRCNSEDSFQVFYSNNNTWQEENSSRVQYLNPQNKMEMVYSIPDDSREIRFDLGEKNESIEISDLNLNYFGKKIKLDINKLYQGRNAESLGNTEVNGDSITIDINILDPYMVYTLDDTEIAEIIQNKNVFNVALKVFMCLVFDLIILVLVFKSKSTREIILDLVKNNKLIMRLAKTDFKTKYAGSYLGIIWAFIQPIVTIIVYWFVFQYGLKSGSPITGVPFALWFITGLVPWFFFSEALVNATNCMLEYSYLVKKVVFKISILPAVKIISSFFVHIAFMIFLIVLFIIYKLLGIYNGIDLIYLVQMLYYSLCTFILVLGISYITSSVVVFFRDLGQLINIILQVGMWMTPIMWSYKIFPEKYQWILKANPLFYIVEGYRDSLINHIWFWNKGNETVVFWCTTLLIFLIGTVVFKKLKPHFADVL